MIMNNIQDVIIKLLPYLSKQNLILRLPTEFDEFSDVFAHVKFLYKIYNKIFSVFEDKICELSSKKSTNVPSLWAMSFLALHKTLIYKLEYLHDYVWEKLNTGYWKDVKPFWRQLYSLLNYIKLALALYAMLICLMYPITSILGHMTIRFQKCNDLVLKLLKICDLSLLSGQMPDLEYETNIFNIVAEHLTPLIVRDESYMFDILQGSTLKNNCYLTDPKVIMKYPLTEASAPPLTTFTQIMRDGQPVKLLDCMTEWPCINKWNNLNYLLSVAGPRLVPVEIGSKYTDENWYQKLMPLGEFIKHYIVADETYITTDLNINKDKIEPTNIRARLKGYLAQHFLFDQIPALKNDFEIPIYCYCKMPKEITKAQICQDGKFAPKKPKLLDLERGDIGDKADNNTDDHDIEINCWFGPGGTVSPLHHDPKPNLLCQVFGTKYVRLYDPVYTARLYHYDSGNLLSANTSPVDVENPDLVLHPEFPKVPYQETYLRAGDMLYIPPRYWHYVRSLTPSFSINFWWS